MVGGSAKTCRQAAGPAAQQGRRYGYLNKFVVVEITTTIRNIPVEIPLGKLRGCQRNASPIAMIFERFRDMPFTNGFRGCLIGAD
jgi:hypothetical protein